MSEKNEYLDILIHPEKYLLTKNEVLWNKARDAQEYWMDYLLSRRLIKPMKPEEGGDILKECEVIVRDIMYSEKSISEQDRALKPYANAFSPEIRFIAGVDISYTQEKDGKNNNDTNSPETAKVAITLYDQSLDRIVEHHEISHPVRIPYKAGFLGFREIPLYMMVLRLLSKTPDVIMVDGHGIMHPFLMGSAVHLGVVSRIPTIGIGKNIYYARLENNLSLKDFKFGNQNLVACVDPLRPFILGVYGVFRKGGGPFFVSPGYSTSLKDAILITALVMREHYLPEPLFWADYYSKSSGSKR